MQTFSDQQDLLMDRFQIQKGPTTYLGRLAMVAINEAYDEIGRKHTWKYYVRRALINTNAAFVDGTIAYNSTTNVVTLTPNTSSGWPLWVLDGELILNQNVYKPGQLLSATTLSLRPDRKPGGDIPSGTGYFLCQAAYVLPQDFFTVYHVEEITRYWQIGYIKPEDYHTLQVAWLYPGTPRWYTIWGNSPRHLGTYSLELLPPPIDQRTLDMIYRAVPRRRTLNTCYQKGTATTSGTTVTLSGGSVTNAIEGCVIRFSSGPTPPTGPYGLSPAVFETTVQQWLSSTTFLLEQAPPTDVSAVAFSIEDPVDIDPICMGQLFNAMCATRFARMNLKEPKLISQLMQTEQLEFLKASSSNQKVDISELWTKYEYAPMNLKELTFTQARN